MIVIMIDVYVCLDVYKLSVIWIALTKITLLRIYMINKIYLFV